MKKLSKLVRATIFILPLAMLAGCPVGDRLDLRYRPDETTSFRISDKGLCLQVPAAGSYQPAIITIFPRETPYKDRWYKDQPDLTVINGQLCIPPSFYHFPDRGQFIVDYVLTSKENEDLPRHVVVGFDIVNGHAYAISLNRDEFVKSE